MAFYGFAWSVPGAMGMYLSGLLLEYSDPRWIWYAASIVGIIAALAFLLMHLQQREGIEADPVPLKVGQRA